MANQLKVCLVKKFPKHIRQSLNHWKFTDSDDDVKLSNTKEENRVVIGVYHNYIGRKTGIHYHQIYVQSALPTLQRYRTTLHEFVHYMLNRVFPKSWQPKVQLWWELIWHWHSRSACRWYRKAYKAAYKQKEQSNG